MAPDPCGSDQGKRTVACNFESLVPDETHKAAIRDAVHRTHKATILATELLNLHVRRRLEERSGVGLDQILTPNWLLNAYNEVTSGRVPTKVVSELRDTRTIQRGSHPCDTYNGKGSEICALDSTRTKDDAPNRTTR
tara:strand:+ start:365 stop:775 length:411 start_codon:yes stop_codon:yes gene_type:complete